LSAYSSSLDTLAQKRVRLIAALGVCSAGFFLAVHDATAKHLIQTLPVVVVIWARYLVHVLIMIGWALRQPAGVGFRSGYHFRHFLRASCLVALSLCFITGLKFVPLAESTALNFLCPLFVLALSAIFLHEQIHSRQWLAVLLGLIGVVIIVRPRGELFTPAALLPCMAALLLSVYQLLTRTVSEGDQAGTSNLWLGAYAVLIMTGMLPFFWALPSLPEIAGMIAMGVAGTCAHAFLAFSYKNASPAYLAPFGYVQIAFSGCLGFVLYGFIPSSATLAGILLIVVSGLVVVLRYK
jgi:drug/metabolite transporter (DMT)-like permease